MSTEKPGKSKRFLPLVSIIIPVYNGEEYVRQAINSALAQTYQNCEVIVVNDGSTDSSEKIIKEYGKRVNYLKKENGGVSTALNLGISKAKGEYISWLSHDDLYTPEKIETQIKALSLLPENVRLKTIAYSNFKYIDNTSKIIGTAPIHRFHQKDKLAIPLYPIAKGLINGCTLLIPKQCFTECGGFDSTLRNTQDYICWLKMFPKYHVMYQKEYLGYSRKHADQGTNTKRAQNEFNDFWIMLMRIISDKDKKSISGSIGNFYFSMVKQMKRYGNPKAMEYAKKRYDDLRESRLLQIWRELLYETHLTGY